MIRDRINTGEVWPMRCVALSAVTAASLLLGACSRGPTDAKEAKENPVTTITTKAPAPTTAAPVTTSTELEGATEKNPSILEFRNTLEAPAIGFSLRLVERLMQPDSITETFVSDDGYSVAITNKGQGAGPDGKFATPDDANIPEARFGIVRRDGVNHLVATVAASLYPLSVEGGQEFASVEVSFEVSPSQNLDPETATLNDIVALLSTPGAVSLTGLDARSFNTGYFGSECFGGIGTYPDKLNPLVGPNTLGCATMVGFLGSLAEIGDPFYQGNPALRDLDQKIATAEIAHISRQLPDASSDIFGNW
jgi:hypothetical protein